MIQTKLLASFAPNVPHPTTMIGTALLDCANQRLAYGTWTVEYSKAGEFASFVNEDEVELEWNPAAQLEGRWITIFNGVCGSIR